MERKKNLKKEISEFIREIIQNVKNIQNGFNLDECLFCDLKIQVDS